MAKIIIVKKGSTNSFQMPCPYIIDYPTEKRQ